MNREKGAVAIMVALLMLVLIGFIGLAIDFGYAYVQKNRLQNVADAEALACVISPPASPCPIGSSANLYPEVNTYNFNVTTDNPGDNSLCPLPLKQNGCARATATTTWNTFFIRLFGLDTLSSSAVAVAGWIGFEQACLITPNYFNVSGSQGLRGTACANYFGNISTNGNPPITGTANFIYNGNPSTVCPTCEPPAISRTGALEPPALAATPALPSGPGTFTGFTGTPDTVLTCPNKTTCTLGPGLYNSLDCSASQAVCRLVPTGNTAQGYTFAFSGDVTGPGSNGVLTGEHVLIYMQGVGRTLSLSGGGSLTLSSPSLTGGACTGTNSPESQIVIYSPNTGTLSYNGNVLSTVSGNIYMPGYGFALGGNGGLNVAGSIVVDGYQDSGGGNQGLIVNGTNACGFIVSRGKAVLVD